MTYAEFLASKAGVPGDAGFECDPSDRLYPFQKDIVRFAARRGLSAVFADCGLGKTPMQLEWARIVHEHTGGNVLILAPLAVSAQTVREGEKFGIEVHAARTAADVGPITVTNYERLHHFDPLPWAGVVLDESSILKSFSGATREALTQWGKRVPYRLCATATPAPNDYEELGGHSEFLDVLTRRQMLAEFFINDGIEAASWRLKGHAQSTYWRWVRTWAMAVRTPSDLGYPDAGFALPPLNVDVGSIDADSVSEDRLFPVPVSTLTERRQARRESLPLRVQHSAEVVNAHDGPCVVWCDLNAESGALTRAIPDAVEVRGSDTPEEKEARLLAFTRGDARVIVTKPGIGGWGLNWQHCARMVFVGLSDSYESYYQAVRRCWRFGQTRPVDVTIVASSREQTVLENVRRKERQAREMFDALVTAA